MNTPSKLQTAPEPGRNAAPAKPESPRPEIDSLDDDDPIDQASYDSFPASDPPAHSSRRAQPGGKRSTR